jgi:hypothetical protein
MNALPVNAHTRWLAPASAFAVGALGRSLQIANGGFAVEAVYWLAVSLAVVLLAAAVERPDNIARVDAYIVPIIAGAVMLANVAQLATARPGTFVHFEPSAQIFFRAGIALLAAVAASAAWGAPRNGKLAQVSVLVAAHFAMGWLVIHVTPHPAIDVDVFHRDAIEALRSGLNPYRMTFPNIYSDAGFYGQGLSVDGRLQFGFPYPPLGLLLAIPGRLLGGDHRYAQLVALETAAVLMAFARPGRFGTLAAVLFLTTPRVFFVLEQSWTEPFLVLGLAAVIFAACRSSRAVPWLFGAFVALKQYLVLALPAALLLLPWPLRRNRVAPLFAKAGAVAFGITLPFFLWGPGAFWSSVVTLQFHQPFRVDALTILAWWVSLGYAPPPSFVPFLVAAIVMALLMWRLPRTAEGFGAMVGVTFLAFFAFNKQAFCNYYFFVIGAFCTSLAAWLPPGDTA